MAIECYFHKCPNHSSNYDEFDGPLCYQDECTASTKELINWTNMLVEERKQYTLKYGKKAQNEFSNRFGIIEILP